MRTHRNYVLIIFCSFLFIRCEFSGVMHPSGFGFYIPYPRMETELKKLAARYPDHMELTRLSYAKDGTEVRTHEDRPIHLVRVSDNVQQDEGEPDVFILSGVHAREWAAIGAGFMLLKHIVTSYGSDQTITNLIDRSELHIVAMANPDGYVYSWRSNNLQHRLWRKNRRALENEFYGVDLNRNWGYQWGAETGENTADPRLNTYRGNAAFSEPETRGLLDALARLSELVLFIDIHSAAQVVLSPWSYIGQMPQDSHLFETGNRIATAMSNTHGVKHAYTATFEYDAAGVSSDYVYATYAIPSFTIETRLEGKGSTIRALFHPPEESLMPTFEELLAGVLAGWDYVLNQLVVPINK